AGFEPSRETALSILRYTRGHLAPYKRIRRIEFAELPKTISGKIRRVQLRALEKERHSTNIRGEHEYWEDDFVDFE
ncbi:MAG TPA: AMP-dependent synthetase, partial [Thermoanaerobaculia bacterium]